MHCRNKIPEKSVRKRTDRNEKERFEMTKKIPMRQCIGCGQMKSKKELLRILKTADDEFTFDVTGRKNGRGAYLCFSKECLQRAMKTKGLERSFQMKIPSEIYERLEKEFEEIDGK